MPPLNRRTFFRAVTLAAGGALIRPRSAVAAPSDESDTVPLGLGVNSATGSLQESAIQFAPGGIGRGEAVSELSFYNRFERYAESMSISISAGGSYGAFSLSNEFSKQHDLARDELTVYCVVKREIRCQPQRAGSIKVQREALELFNQSPEEFVARYGDEYISGVVWGGGYVGVIALSCTSADERDAWSNTLEASFAGSKLSAAGSASISQTWERFKKSTRLSARHVSYGVPHAFELRPPAMGTGNAQSEITNLNDLIAHFVSSSEAAVVDAFEQGQHRPRQYYVPITVQRRAYAPLIPGSAGTSFGTLRNRLVEERRLIAQARRQLRAWQSAQDLVKQVIFHPEHFDATTEDLELWIGQGIWNRNFRRAEHNAAYTMLDERIATLADQLGVYVQHVNEQPASEERPALELPELDDIPEIRRTRGTPYLLREPYRNHLLTLDPKNGRLFLTSARARDLTQRWIVEPALNEGGYWLRNAQNRQVVVWRKEQGSAQYSWQQLTVADVGEDGSVDPSVRLLNFELRPSTTFRGGRNPNLTAICFPVGFWPDLIALLKPMGDQDNAPAVPRGFTFDSTGDTVSWFMDPINPRDFS
jgi:hypothetical protein